MCGIVGVLTSSVTIPERKAFKDLLFMDTLRGWDSTGLIVRDTKKDTYMYKRALPAPDFMFLPVPKKMIDCSWKMAIGHNRAATKGAVNDVNAHPYQHGNIIGCHNGTLTSTTNLEDHSKFSVDSDNIFYDMQKHGAEVTIPKLRGAFCLVWYDTEKDTFNIVRNDQRPMYYCWNKASNFFAFASEEHMLRAAISGDRQGRSEIEVQEVRELKVGQWIQINVDTLKTTIKQLELDTDPLPYKSYNRGWQGKQSGKVQNHATTTTTPTKQTQPSSHGGKNNSTTRTNNVLPMPKTHGPTPVKVRVVDWQEVQGHNNNVSYVAYGQTPMGQAAEVYINKEVYDIFTDEDAPLPESIMSVRVSTKIVNQEPIAVFDATQEFQLKYSKPVQTAAGASTEKKPEAGTARPAGNNIYFGFNSETLTSSAYLARTKKGCSHCGITPNLADSKRLHWLDCDHHLCSTCAQDYFEQRIGVRYDTDAPHCYSIN